MSFRRGTGQDYEVEIPAAVWGHDYAKSAAKIWKIKSQRCSVVKFKAGKALKDHRWFFDWTDPESTSTGTLDFTHVGLYMRKANPADD